jgi:hypothetical protein
MQHLPHPKQVISQKSRDESPFGFQGINSPNDKAYRALPNGLRESDGAVGNENGYVGRI